MYVGALGLVSLCSSAGPIITFGNEMAAQVLNDSCHRQRGKDAKKMMHNFYEDSSKEAFSC